MSEAFRDPDLPTSERVEDLLRRMTLAEKLAQLGCVWSTELVRDGAFSPERAQALLAHGTGHITRIGAATGLTATLILACVKGTPGPKHLVAFGPYLALGLWITWLYGPVNLHWG